MRYATTHKAAKHTSRDKVGCPWHRRIKKISKKLATRIARRLLNRSYD